LIVQATYTRCARAAGFSETRFHSLQVSQEALKIMGDDFWCEYIETAPNVVFEARKSM
jgi:hypothetical protein